jgi:hypothetical protein
MGDGGVDASVGADGGDAGSLPECEATPADAALGIFVSPAGSSVVNCGSAASPCSTIAQGMARARATARSLVYIDSGTYGETVVLLAGLTLRGGWDNIAGEWTRKCTADRAASAVITSPAEVGLVADYVGEATLDTLTVRTKPLANASESTYAVVVRGTGTKLVLSDVIAVAADAGHGAQGAAGASPPAAIGQCAPGSGANGTSDGSPGDGASRGAFESTGYVRRDGVRGGTGASGQPGTQAPEPICAECSSCEHELGSICVGVGASCGEAGPAGCGGPGGAGGEGGYGGGSSVALFVWDATVDVAAGRLEAGRGGDGGPGGAPGGGGAGSPGLTGAVPASCDVCSDGAGQCFHLGSAQGMSTTGGNGGAGAQGGTGGSGAGGFSYAVFKGGSANVTISSVTGLAFGAAGTGATNGAAGLAAAIGP